MTERLPKLLKYLHKFDQMLFFDIEMPSEVPGLEELPLSIEVEYPEIKKETFFACTPDQAD